MNQLLNQLLSSFLQKIEKIFKNFCFYITKISIYVTHTCFYTGWYFFYVSCVIVASFCTADFSYLYMISQCVMVFVLASSLLSLFLLNFNFTRRKIETVLGNPFLEKYLPGEVKGLIPFLIYLFTISTLGLIESQSIKNRVTSQIKDLKQINDQIDSFRESPQTFESLRDLSQTLVKLSGVPENFADTGVLTDLSNFICSFL